VSAPPLSRDRVRQALRYLVAVAFTLVAAVFTVPDLLGGLDRRSPFAQLVSFRPWVLVGLLLVTVLLAVMLRFDRRVWPFVAGALVVLLVGAGLTLPRAVAGPVPTAGTPLKVLAFNAYEGRADVQELAALIRTEQPDLISVEEAGPRFSARLAPLIEPLGYRLYPSTGAGPRDVQNVTAAVSERLGDVTVRVGHETSTFPEVVVTGGGLGSLEFVAFHSVAPTPGSVPDWVSDLAYLQRWCAGDTPAVVVGDFNATLDHSALRAGTAGCSDAASQRGQGLTPTWGPVNAIGEGLRAVIGPAIDHIFATEAIQAETFAVHDLAGSDHRAITSTLRIPG
jgi:endonuclease/exonuclease/phosphatase (EEP) superfamily protein YafD